MLLGNFIFMKFKKMFFPQIFSAVGSSSLVISVQQQVTVCIIKVSGVVAGEGPLENFVIFFLLSEKP